MMSAGCCLFHKLDEHLVDRRVRGLIEILLVDALDAFADHIGRRNQHRPQQPCSASALCGSVL